MCCPVMSSIRATAMCFNRLAHSPCSDAGTATLSVVLNVETVTGHSTMAMFCMVILRMALGRHFALDPSRNALLGGGQSINGPLNGALHDPGHRRGVLASGGTQVGVVAIHLLDPFQR